MYYFFIIYDMKFLERTYSGIEIAKGVNIAEVFWRMFIGFLEAAVVVIDDGIEDLSENGVSVGVGRIDTNTGIMILQTRLNNIQESGAERGLSGL